MYSQPQHKATHKRHKRLTRPKNMQRCFLEIGRYDDYQHYEILSLSVSLLYSECITTHTILSFSFFILSLFLSLFLFLVLSLSLFLSQTHNLSCSFVRNALSLVVIHLLHSLPKLNRNKLWQFNLGAITLAHTQYIIQVVFITIVGAVCVCVFVNYIVVFALDYSTKVCRRLSLRFPMFFCLFPYSIPYVHMNRTRIDIDSLNRITNDALLSHPIPSISMHTRICRVL